jgi:hypothetical protein
VHPSTVLATSAVQVPSVFFWNLLAQVVQVVAVAQTLQFAVHTAVPQDLVPAVKK